MTTITAATNNTKRPPKIIKGNKNYNKFLNISKGIRVITTATVTSMLFLTQHNHILLHQK